MQGSLFTQSSSRYHLSRANERPLISHRQTFDLVIEGIKTDNWYPTLLCNVDVEDVAQHGRRRWERRGLVDDCGDCSVDVGVVDDSQFV